MKTLGGSLFIYNGVSQDYSFVEALECLYDLCDCVAIVCGGDDGTIEKVREWFKYRGFVKGVKIKVITQEEWEAHHGQTKLSHFTNLAMDMLSTDWIINLQGDEIIQENCFDHIRRVIQNDNVEAFVLERINLWACPYTALNVEQSRKPVSTDVIRLAKKQYRAYDDAEQLAVPSAVSTEPRIRMYHTGFVRDRHKHLVKIRHMQEKVFLWDVDKRIHDCKDGFDPWVWGFTPLDVEPIIEPLPKYIQVWAKEREYDPFTYDGDGYKVAKLWLEHIGQWDHVSTHGFSTDGWSIIQTANSLWWQLVKKYQTKKPD